MYIRFFFSKNETKTVTSRSGVCCFYMHQIRGACAGMCTCNCSHQMEKTEPCKRCYEHILATDLQCNRNCKLVANKSKNKIQTTNELLKVEALNPYNAKTNE